MILIVVNVLFCLVDPCEGFPCKNGGTCVADGETYVCRCESGYEGPTCEQEGENVQPFT